MMLDQVKNLSHQMRLFGIHEGCERRAQEALSQQLHPLEFLRLVLEDEVLSRKDRTAKALVTKARFRFRADLEDWDYSSNLAARLIVYTHPLLSILVTRAVFVLTSIIKSYIKEFTV